MEIERNLDRALLLFFLKIYFAKSVIFVFRIELKKKFTVT